MKTILSSIGETPIVRLKNLYPKLFVFAKLEGQNPGGSVKDRVALHMVQKAIEKKELTQTKRILEATSGNMGISLAMVGAAMQIPVTIVMSEAMSEERKQMMRAFGAELILTDKSEGTFGAIKKAKQLITDFPNKYWFANQFENKENINAHANSLAPEILRQFPDVDIIIGGVGTSGTMVGIAQFFKKHKPEVEIFAVTPPKGFKVQGIQNPYTDFRPQIYEENLFKYIISVSTEEAFLNVKKIVRKEGIFVGLSSGAVGAAFSQIKINSNQKILLIFPDRGEKYLSTGVFA